MSFVKRGEKKMRNMAKAGSKPGMRGAQSDSFGKKGDGHRSGAPHNMATASDDMEETPVSEDAEGGDGYTEGGMVAKSEYDPASGKKAKSVADLRAAAKKLNERSDAGEDSPVGSEGGQDGKHSNSKNATGWMKGSDGKMGKMSKKPVKKPASQEMDDDEMMDPMDEDEEDSEQTHDGMTPNGKPRKSTKMMKQVKERINR